MGGERGEVKEDGEPVQTFGACLRAETRVN